MPINDNNPERRNLIVLSMSIVAFYVGKATIKDDGNLALPLINVQFHDSYHLACLVWIVLIWFTFRYWLQNRLRLRNEFFSELNDESYFQYFWGERLKKHTKVRMINSPNYKFKENGFKYHFEMSETDTVDKYKGALMYTYEVSGVPTGITIPVPLKGKIRILIILFLGFRVFFVKPSLSANLGPLILAGIAFGFRIFY